MFSILQFDLPTLFAIAAIILFAGLVHGTLGLGFPMVATPMLAAMMDVRSAILITLLPTVTVNIISITSKRSDFGNTRQYWPLVWFTLFGSIIGAVFLAIMDPAPFRIMLAGLIILYLWNGLRISRQWLLDHSLLAMLGFGLIAGFSGGTTNVMVAILIIYFLSLNTPRSTLVPALNSCFLAGKLSQIAVLAIAGLVGFELLLHTLPLAVIAAVALLLGQQLQDRIDTKTYESILRKLLAILAIILIYQFAAETGLIPEF